MVVVIYSLAIVALLILGAATQAMDEALKGIAVVAALAALYQIVYFYNFVRAPDRIYAQQRQTIEKQSGQIASSEDRLPPKIEIQYLEEDRDCFVPVTLSNGTDGRYVRIAARNVSETSIEGCRAYVIHLSRENDDGRKEVLLSEPTQICWSGKSSSQDAVVPVTLLPDLVQYVDLLAFSSQSVFAELQIWPRLNRYEQIIDHRPAEYEIKVLIQGNSTRSRPLTLRFYWEGKISTAKVRNA